MCPGKIGSQIRMLYPEMSKTEQILVDYIFSLTAEQILRLKLKDIACDNSISPPAVVKFAKRIGLSGFKELKAVLSEYVKQQPFGEMVNIRVNDDTAAIMQKIFNISKHSLDETYEILDFRALEDAAYYLLNAKSRYFFGLGASALIAGDAYHKFQRIGLKSEYTNDANVMIIQAALMDRNDIILVVSHSGSSSSLIQAVSVAKSRGAKIICVTGCCFSKLAKLSNITLCSTATSSSKFISDETASRIAKLNIIDGLFVVVANQNEEVFAANLKVSDNMADKICRE